MDVIFEYWVYGMVVKSLSGAVLTARGRHRHWAVGRDGASRMTDFV